MSSSRFPAWRDRLGALAVTAILLASTSAASAPSERWMAAWASAMAPAEGGAAPGAPSAAETVRQSVRVGVGGRRLRLRLSNDQGLSPLALTAVRVARGAIGEGGALAMAADQRPVTFAGQATATIPAHAYLLSDPIDLALGDDAVLTVSIAFAAPPRIRTVHPLALTTGYRAPGDQTAAWALSDAGRIDHWLHLAAVEVERAPLTPGGVVAVLGDSITDGHGATRDGDDRWTDVLARRLRQDRAFAGISVLNLGLAGNRLMADRGEPGPLAQPGGLARLDRDVFSQAGLTTVIVAIGVNDLGLISRDGPVTPDARAAAVDGLIAGYGQIITRARAQGVKVIGATLTPFGGTSVYRSDAAADEDRQRVNAWIRTPGRFDAVIDFDAAVRDPGHPERLAPAFDTGDHLHPSAAGYRAMGEAVALPDLKAEW